MRRYDEYKETGIKWIPQIPKHWGIEPFGRHFSYGKGLPITKADLLPDGEAVISYGQIHSKLNRGTSITSDLIRFVSANYLKSNPNSLLKLGDFIFADTSEDVEGSGNCAYNNLETTIFAGYHTVIARPIDLENTNFFAYLFLSKPWKNQVQSLVNGVKVYSIGKKHLKKSFLLFPPLAEQENIVSFLDSKTLKIDAYVAERERELQLLSELKESEIANIITRGLNPDVKMKDSGIPWLGMIPEHWTLRRIKYIFTELKEKSENGLEMPLSLSREEGIIPFSEKKNKTMESASYVGGKIVHKGEIVFNRFRARLFAISEYDGIVSSDYAVYKCQVSASSEYMVKLFSTDMYREAFNRKASGIGDGFNRLYTNDLFSMYAIFPPLEEQKAIVAYIEEKCNKVNSLIRELEAEIEYLKEYKQKLIADCVTGQIDVRNT